MNINKLFPWLSIRAKLIIAFSGLSIIPIVVVGTFALFSTANDKILSAKAELNNDVQLIRERAAGFLVDVEADMNFLSNSGVIQDVMNVRAGSPSKMGKQVESLLIDFVNTKKIYNRIRILNASGFEVLRVESSSGIPDLGPYVTVDKMGLSPNKEYYYEYLTDSLHQGQIAFSPAEIIGRNGQRIAVISFAMPVFNKGKKIGVLVADVFASGFFETLESQNLDSSFKSVYVVSGDGHYLYNSKKRKSWDRLFVLTKGNLRDEYPEAAYKKIVSGETGIISKGMNDVVSFAPMFPLTNIKTPVDRANFSISLFVVESIQKSQLLKPVYSATKIFAFAIVGFLFLSVTLSLLATRQFTRPIAEMRRGAEIISAGNYAHRLNIETRDELEKLAEQFNSMAESLLVRDQELRNHRAILEKMVLERTRELSEEKSKLQAILDNVPSAILVLDPDLKIQTVSAALSRITGYKREDVIGRSCSDFFCNSGFCRTCISRTVIQSGKSIAHLDEIAGPDGADRYLEHFSIPMEEDGKVTAILEIITDVTERKRIEQQLIKTEKLATVGELAAFIAHEFRNSLTSIKMILQLFSESTSLEPADKESLAVALNSAYRMESTVTELLGFVRPAVMDFNRGSVNDALNEAISFVRLRADRAKVQIEKDLDASLPDLTLDIVHMREAFVNILLNAIQAIENQSLASPGKKWKDDFIGRIVVSTNKIKLAKNIRDFVYVDIGEFSGINGTGTIREISLEKGSECIEIWIEDTGPGIEKPNLSRIFDPFFTTKPNGTGLGLPMAKRVVNGHGGVITVESKIGSGTRFRIVLPL